MATWTVPGELKATKAESTPATPPPAKDGPPDGIKAVISDSQGARRIRKPKGKGKGTKRNLTPRHGPARDVDRSVRRKYLGWTAVSPTLEAAFLASMVHNLPRHGKRKLRTTSEQKREDRRESLVSKAVDLQAERKHGRSPPGPSRPLVQHNGDFIPKLKTRDIARLFKRDHPTFVRIIVN